MYYYEVLVSSQRYHKDSPLTYAADIKLDRGSVVTVPLQRQTVLGVILKEVAKPKFATKQLQMLDMAPVLPEAQLKLLDWLKTYYPAPLGQITGLFLSGVLLKAKSEEIQSEFVKLKPRIDKRALTREQQAAVKTILSHTAGTILLHGDTGTGKTWVYQEITAKALADGKSVIVLTPEIGLTSQLVEIFSHQFPGQTIVMHSDLTPKERRVRWLQAASTTQPLVVIGPRSALFAPLHSVGLIVMDEAHDTAYKQEQAPYYQTARVAAQLANLHKARFIMGSATPLIQDYFLAQAKGVPVLRMKEPAVKISATERQVDVVDLRIKNNVSNHPLISKQLLDAIKQSLVKKQQTLIFLNRRGTARLILCSMCGWQAVCPRCDVPLTYHADHHTFTCHTCGFEESALSSCPNCNSPDILFKVAGTKAIAAVLSKEFPDAVIKRFDTDNTKYDSLEQNFASITSGDTDILVGTQMIGKGLDLPKLGLVGILAADASLYFPDFTATERTYQLLYQVIGRVGRGHIAGRAIIQTYNPENETLQQVIRGDWEGFYTQQLEERRLFLYPPFCYILKLVCTRSTPASATSTAEKLLQTLQAQRLHVQLIGPSPNFYHKVAGKYRWQIIVKTKNRGELLKIIPLLPSGWSYDLDPINLL